MNRLGGRSNTGEGGEDPARFLPDANGDLRRSAVKQVASGPVRRHRASTSSTPTTSRSRWPRARSPARGASSPAHKVYPWIAKTRYSTPGVGLISPPPHHDIYSIEDIAQLIHDLKIANPRARVHVKLVAEVGVGTVAAGVAKAHSDVVLISGHDGGTGAAPLTSLKHAGIPWELGLAETQQTLMAQRAARPDRRPGRRPDEDRPRRRRRRAARAPRSSASPRAPLVVSGCVMMRVCHLDTCPVGIATQNPELRKRFNGQPEFVDDLLRVHRRGGPRAPRRPRLALARGGDRPGRPARHRRRPSTTGRRAGLDLTADADRAGLAVRDGDVLHPRAGPRARPGARPRVPRRLPAGHRRRHARWRSTCRSRNVDRTVGTMLGSEITRRHGGAGLPDGHDRPDVPRLGRAELRGVRAAAA